MPEPMKFRKKPVVVEAFQMTKDRRLDNFDWPEWLNRAWSLPEGTPGAMWCCHGGVCADLPKDSRELGDDHRTMLGTLEGAHLVGWGDWIIRGVQGELYPVKPDIFAATYEQVQAPDA